MDVKNYIEIVDMCFVIDEHVLNVLLSKKYHDGSIIKFGDLSLHCIIEEITQYDESSHTVSLVNFNKIGNSYVFIAYREFVNKIGGISKIPIIQQIYNN